MIASASELDDRRTISRLRRDDPAMLGAPWCREKVRADGRPINRRYYFTLVDAARSHSHGDVIYFHDGRCWRIWTPSGLI